MKFKKFLAQVVLFFNTFFSKIRKWLDKEGPNIVRFLNAVKTVVDNPGVNLAVAASQNKIDDAVLKWLQVYLAKAITVLNIQIECDAKGSDIEKIECYISHLRTLSPEMQNAIRFKTASIMLRLKRDEKGIQLSDSEIDTLIQLEVSKLKNA